MKLTIDTTAAAESKPKPLPAGQYPMRVETITLKTAKTGTQYLNWMLRISDRPGQVGAKRIVWMKTSLVDAALWKLDECWKALGVGSTIVDLEINETNHEVMGPMRLFETEVLGDLSFDPFMDSNEVTKLHAIDTTTGDMFKQAAGTVTDPWA